MYIESFPQFLVQVFASEAECASKPEFILDTPRNGDCVGVLIGDQWTDDIVAYGGGPDVG